MQIGTNPLATQGARDRRPGQGQQMVDADYDDFGDLPPGSQNPGGPVFAGQRSGQGSGQRSGSGPWWVHLTGALVSMGLLVGFSVWGYRLATLEVTGVPVVRAVEGPMRIVPADPGGEIIEFQGLAVNDVAADGVAAAIPDRLILAPRPTELTDEDVAGLVAGQVAGQVGVLTEASALPDGLGLDGGLDGASDLALAAAPKVESASPTAIAVDAALAEALGLTPEPVAATETAALPDDAVPALETLPAGAMARSPRPKPRPDLANVSAASGAPADLAADAVAELPPVQEVDPASIALGTRLVQFGTYDSTDDARTAWTKLAAEFGELMGSKAMVLQPAESNGRSFWRLRAHGFEDEADARRFCVAFVAKDLICIPVPQR